MGDAALGTGKAAMRFRATSERFRIAAFPGGDAPVPIADVALPKGAPGVGSGAVAVVIPAAPFLRADAAPAKGAVAIGMGAVPLASCDAAAAG